MSETILMSGRGWRSMLDELIDTFHGDRRPLLITTNCDVAGFKVRYGERIADRLRESGRWISVDGGSMRRKP